MRCWGTWLWHSYNFPSVLSEIDSQIIWYSPAIPLCIAIDYPSIAIHAISREGDRVAGNLAHIYAQLDSMAIKESGGRNGHAVEHDSDEEEQTAELRLVPDDAGACEHLEHFYWGDETPD